VIYLIDEVTASQLVRFHNVVVDERSARIHFLTLRKVWPNLFKCIGSDYYTITDGSKPSDWVDDPSTNLLLFVVRAYKTIRTNSLAALRTLEFDFTGWLRYVEIPTQCTDRLEVESFDVHACTEELESAEFLCGDALRKMWRLRPDALVKNSRIFNRFYEMIVALSAYRLSFDRNTGTIYGNPFYDYNAKFKDFDSFSEACVTFQWSSLCFMLTHEETLL